MKTFLDCIPCIVRQTLDSVRLVTSNEAVHERVLREVLRATADGFTAKPSGNVDDFLAF